MDSQQTCSSSTSAKGTVRLNKEQEDLLEQLRSLFPYLQDIPNFPEVLCTFQEILQKFKNLQENKSSAVVNLEDYFGVLKELHRIYFRELFKARMQKIDSERNEELGQPQTSDTNVDNTDIKNQRRRPMELDKLTSFISPMFDRSDHVNMNEKRKCTLNKIKYNMESDNDDEEEIPSEKEKTQKNKSYEKPKRQYLPKIKIKPIIMPNPYKRKYKRRKSKRTNQDPTEAQVNGNSETLMTSNDTSDMKESPNKRKIIPGIFQESTEQKVHSTQFNYNSEILMMNNNTSAMEERPNKQKIIQGIFQESTEQNEHSTLTKYNTEDDNEEIPKKKEKKRKYKSSEKPKEKNLPDIKIVPISKPKRKYIRKNSKKIDEDSKKSNTLTTVSIPQYDYNSEILMMNNNTSAMEERPIKRTIIHGIYQESTEQNDHSTQVNRNSEILKMRNDTLDMEVHPNKRNIYQSLYRKSTEQNEHSTQINGNSVILKMDNDTSAMDVRPDKQKFVQGISQESTEQNEHSTIIKYNTEDDNEEISIRKEKKKKNKSSEKTKEKNTPEIKTMPINKLKRKYIHKNSKIIDEGSKKSNTLTTVSISQVKCNSDVLMMSKDTSAVEDRKNQRKIDEGIFQKSTIPKEYSTQVKCTSEILMMSNDTTAMQDKKRKIDEAQYDYNSEILMMNNNTSAMEERPIKRTIIHGIYQESTEQNQNSTQINRNSEILKIRNDSSDLPQDLPNKRSIYRGTYQESIEQNEHSTQVNFNSVILKMSNETSAMEERPDKRKIVQGIFHESTEQNEHSPLIKYNTEDDNEEIPKKKKKMK